MTNRNRRMSNFLKMWIIACFCFACSFSSTSFAAGSDTLEACRFLRQADSLYRNAEFDPAFDYYDKAAIGFNKNDSWGRYIVCQNRKAELNIRKSNLVAAEQIAMENMTFISAHFPPAGMPEAAVNNILGEIQLNK